MRWIVLVVLALLPNTLCAQTARYRGRIYTPSSFPRATTCGCAMCREIRRQWARATVNTSMSVVQTPRKQVIATRVETPTTTTRTRLVTRTRRVPYRIKVCHGSYCTYETRYRLENYTVCEPVAIVAPVQTSVSQPTKAVAPAPTSPKPSILEPIEKPTKAPELPDSSAYRGTPPAFARAVLDFLSPNPSDVVYDLGCGEGELLAAAAPFGCKVFGIEIDQTRADTAAWRVPVASVVWGDIMHQNYSDGTIFLAYLFPDIVADVIPKLPRGAVIVSLEHDIPGLTTYEHRISIAGQEHAFYVGVI